MAHEIAPESERIAHGASPAATDREAFVDSLHSRLALAELQALKPRTRDEHDDVPGSSPTKLFAEGMPIPVDASKYIPFEDSTNQCLVDKRRDSADLVDLEARAKEHLNTIVETKGSTAKSDKPNWPLLYQIIDVDPETSASEFPEAARRSLIKLSLKHGPPVLDEHPEAAQRWEIVTQAYDKLSDPEQKRLYDMQHVGTD